jgi:hypothetical protein
MPVLINGIALAPAPASVTFAKTFSRNVGGGIIGIGYEIELGGTIIAYKGNPEPTGISRAGQYVTYSSTDDPISSIADTDLLTTIINKQQYIRNICASSETGLLLEIIGYNTSSGITAYCDLNSIKFDESSAWTNRCGYTINLTTSLLTGTNGEESFLYYVSEVSEDWSIAEQENLTATPFEQEDQYKVYKITHNCSAIGKRVYGQASALEQAKGYVQSVLGLGLSNMPKFMQTVSTMTAYNQKITESINKFTGAYSIVEEFTALPVGQSATEAFSVTIGSDVSSLINIQVQGTINGLDSLGIKSNSSDKYIKAKEYWDGIEDLIYERALFYLTRDQCPLNKIPLTTSVGRNVTEGTITYNYTYDNRPNNLIVGALSESIDIEDSYPGQNIGVVDIIGRSQPILQYLNSRGGYSRTLRISANMPMSMPDCKMVKPSSKALTDVFNLYKPVATKVYYSAPSESWNPETGAYSYQISWTFEGPSTSNNY